MTEDKAGKVHVAKFQYAGKAGFRYRLVTESSEPLDFVANDYDSKEEAEINAATLGYDLDEGYQGVDFWMVPPDRDETSYVPQRAV